MALKRITIRNLDADVYLKAQVLAKLEGTPIGHWINALILKELKRRRR